MKAILPSAVVLLLFFSRAFAGDPVTFQNPPPPAFTETNPDFLFFKEGTFARLGTNRVGVDITLEGNIPNNLRGTRVAYHLYFDIDDDKSTGEVAKTFPSFGKDISVYFIKTSQSNRFEGSSTQLRHRGKVQDIRVSKLKVNDNKITCELSSELFGQFPSLRFYGMSYQASYDNGMQSDKTWVDQLPRKGALTLPGN